MTATLTTSRKTPLIPLKKVGVIRDYPALRLNVVVMADRTFFRQKLQKISTHEHLHPIFRETARGALDLFRYQSGMKIDVAIVTLKRPHGDAFTNVETDDEKITGRVLYGHLRKYHADRYLPFIFLVEDDSESDSLESIESRDYHTEIFYMNDEKLIEKITEAIRVYYPNGAYPDKD
jgi:hypothetical protein